MYAYIMHEPMRIHKTYTMMRTRIIHKHAHKRTKIIHKNAHAHHTQTSYTSMHTHIIHEHTNIIHKHAYDKSRDNERGWGGGCTDAAVAAGCVVMHVLGVEY